MRTGVHKPFGQENSYFFLTTIFIVKKWPLFEPSVPIAGLIFWADFFSADTVIKFTKKRIFHFFL